MRNRVPTEVGMLDISNLQSYFRELRMLRDDAQQFPWKPAAGSGVTLRAVELAHKPIGVTQAALTVCAALGVACKKTLAMLNAKSAEKALPPSPAFGLPAIGISLISKMRPEDRRAGFYVVSGS